MRKKSRKLNFLFMIFEEFRSVFPGWNSPRRQIFLLLTMLLAINLSCTSRLPLIEEDTRLIKNQPFLARDLLATSRDLSGDSVQDLQRLELLPDAIATAIPFSAGYLQLIKRDNEQLLVWLGAGKRAGVALFLARSDSLRILDFNEYKKDSWDMDRQKVLILEENGRFNLSKRKIIERSLSGQQRVLAEAPTWELRYVEYPGPGFIFAAKEKSSCFIEYPGSMHLEVSRSLISGKHTWSLGPAQKIESEYRCLNRFLKALRRHKWKKAAREVDLRKLLALPGGGWSNKFAQTMKLSLPYLMDKKLMLKAPARGSLNRIEDDAGLLAWRVEFRQTNIARSSDNKPWFLTSIERVE
jgi:hypothetical protein